MIARVASLALLGCLLIALAGGSLANAPSTGALHGLRVEPPKSVPAQALIDESGRPRRFPVAQRQWQLAAFGYTNCPDVCPMTLHKTAMLLAELGANADRLQVWFVSIDTPRDDPAQIKSFVSKFDSRIKGLTGDAAVVQALANDFNIMTRRFQGKTALAYTLEHSSFLYLIDPDGLIRIMYPATADAQGIAADLRQLWLLSAAKE
jgi:protein SCO1/2